MKKKKEERVYGQHRISHGAHSGTIRQKYSDRRTTEGKQPADIMSGLVSDLGGQGAITNAQRLTLANIRTKCIVLLQIGKYIDKQDSVINSNDELIPCLGRGFTAYSEAIRRDLEALFKFNQGKKNAVPSIEDIIQANK